jgi:sugar phosphate permease
LGIGDRRAIVQSRQFQRSFFAAESKAGFIPDAQIPLVLVVMNLSYALSAYPVGVLSDRINRQTLLLMGWGLNAVIYMGLAIAQDPWQVWLLVGGYGLYLGMTQGYCWQWLRIGYQSICGGQPLGF